MRLVSLGCGGYIPNGRRETASYLLIDGPTAVLFDIGTGAKRLLEPPLSLHLTQIEKLHVVLSHYHLDHSIGLTWMLKIWPKPFNIIAPQAPLVSAEAADALSRLSSPPLFALPLDEYPGSVTIQELRTKTFTIDGLHIDAMPQAHSGGSVAYRVGTTFAYVTDVDTTDSAAHVEFIRGVDLAFVDAMYDQHTYRQQTENVSAKLDHGYDMGVARLGAEAAVGGLGLVHISPEYDEKRVDSMTAGARGIFPSAFIPKDGQEFAL